ncbi:MAG: type II toxin-antitoxin system RelE family toxin [Candidatus Brocadiia bacterium]
MEGVRPYRVVLTRSAQRFVEGADAPLQRRLRRAFDMLRARPRDHPNATRLKGEFAGHYRFRVGDYRVLYCIHQEQQTVEVVTIAHRREAYRP